MSKREQAAADRMAGFGPVAERFRRAGDLERAITLCREGLAKSPEHLSGRVTLGWALLDLGRYDEARTELQLVLKRAPDNLAAIRGLAELHDRAESTMFLDMGGQSDWPPPDDQAAEDQPAEDLAAALTIPDTGALVETSPTHTFEVSSIPPDAASAAPVLAPISVRVSPELDEVLPEIITAAQAAMETYSEAPAGDRSSESYPATPVPASLDANVPSSDSVVAASSDTREVEALLNSLLSPVEPPGDDAPVAPDEPVAADVAVSPAAVPEAVEPVALVEPVDPSFFAEALEGSEERAREIDSFATAVVEPAPAVELDSAIAFESPLHVLQPDADHQTPHADLLGGVEPADMGPVASVADEDQVLELVEAGTDYHAPDVDEARQAGPIRVDEAEVPSSPLVSEVNEPADAEPVPAWALEDRPEPESELVFEAAVEPSDEPAAGWIPEAEVANLPEIALLPAREPEPSDEMPASPFESASAWEPPDPGTARQLGHAEPSSALDDSAPLLPVAAIAAVEPVEPVALIEPVELVEAIAPVELVELVEHVAAVEPVAFVEPVETAALVEPIELAAPVEPVAPVESVGRSRKARRRAARRAPLPALELLLRRVEARRSALQPEA